MNLKKLTYLSFLKLELIIIFIFNILCRFYNILNLFSMVGIFAIFLIIPTFIAFVYEYIRVITYLDFGVTSHFKTSYDLFFISKEKLKDLKDDKQKYIIINYKNIVGFLIILMLTFTIMILIWVD